MTRIIFMGTPEFAVPSLQTLIDFYHVVGVVTQPDRPAGRGQTLHLSPIKRLAVGAGIPVYQPHSLRNIDAAAPLQELNADVIVVAAFGQILPPAVLELAPHGCINVHASLLPRWRGASPIQHAILAGDRVSGISLMQLDEGMDTGPVYARVEVRLSPDETAQSLHDKLAEEGAQGLRLHLDDILAGNLLAEPQDDQLATYAPLIKKEDGLIDWRQPAVQIERLIRAMTPWPGAYTVYQDTQLKILSARVAPVRTTSGEATGTVVGNDHGAIIVTGSGLLSLLKVQLAGRKSMDIGAFLRGRSDFLGSQLGS